MAQYCTILCPADEPPRTSEFVHRLVAGRSQVAVDGPSNGWHSIHLTAPGSTLVLNRRVFRQAGDEFAKMRLQMWMYFDHITTPHTQTKQSVLDRVEGYQLALGVVGEPKFVAAAGHLDCIFGLAKLLDGIIWNGSGVSNHEGLLLLDADGKSEVV